MNKSIFYVIFCLIVLGCNSQSNTQKAAIGSNTSKEKPDKNAFFRVVDILSDEDRLKKCYDSLRISPDDVYAFCLNNQDALVKARLIKSTYLEVKNNKKAAKTDFWSDIRFDMYKFTDLIDLLKESQSETFMDIGCGSGQKLFAGLCMGFRKVYGLEYSEKSVEYANEFLKDFIDKGQIEITHGDALTIEGKYYSQADFIYTYSPMKDNEMMSQLFKRTMENMKEGAIFLEVRMVYYKELKVLTKKAIPQHKGFFAVKKEKGAFYYKNEFNRDDWEKLENI